jgi:hypothetical protein
MGEEHFEFRGGVQPGARNGNRTRVGDH